MHRKGMFDVGKGCYSYVVEGFTLRNMCIMH